MSHKIREAEASDFDSLSSLYQELNPEDPPLSREQHLALLEKIISAPDLHIFVLSKSARVLATNYVNIIPNLTRGGAPYAVIENVVTLSSERNRGLGKKLLLHTLNFAWQQGCYKAMLLTSSKEESTHHFYRSCGFDSETKQAYISYRDFK